MSRTTRSLKRFFISASLADLAEKRKNQYPTVLLTKEETHHLRDVLRLREGSLCLLVDGFGNEFVSCIEHFLANGSVELKPLEPAFHSEKEFLELTVAQAIPQDRKMDEIIEKAAELGIWELIPLLTERTVVRVSGDRVEKVLSRWERIAEQTIKQSRLRRVPKLGVLTAFKDLCQSASEFDQRFLLHPLARAKPICEVTQFVAKGRVPRILLAIGPEGGFSQNELDLAGSNGFEMLKMGSWILKTDTAFVAASSFLMLKYSV